MRRLARSDLAVVIEGQDRRDEIGLMAGAVQVFKENALRATVLEAEAAAARTREAQTRREADAERQEAARAQAAVVDGLATGLEKLSVGDLEFRLGTPFRQD
jgi:methyl-accepting chemotaxis protein